MGVLPPKVIANGSAMVVPTWTSYERNAMGLEGNVWGCMRNEYQHSVYIVCNECITPALQSSSAGGGPTPSPSGQRQTG